MTKLVSESTITMLQNYDEAFMNKNFNPFAFYQIVQLISLKNEIPDKDAKNLIYRRLYKSIMHGDAAMTRKLIHRIKSMIDQDRGLINQFLEKQILEEQKDDDTVVQVWNKKSIGVLSYFAESV